MSYSILVLAGGGGHTGYAHVIAQSLAMRSHLLFFIPEHDLLSRKRLEPFGKIQTLVKPRHPETQLHQFVPRLAHSSIQTLRKFPRHCDLVVSTGSNFCIPPSIFAWLSRIPLINIESADRLLNPSKTALILQHFSTLTALQWDEQKRFLNGKVFGPFLPQRILEPWHGGYILVASGTYGYEGLAKAISESNLENVILQVGEQDPRIYRAQHPDWKITSTTERFYELIAGAEVVIAPPGVTCLEAVSYEKPLVVVKYPEWSRAGTQHEARRFAEKLKAPFVKELTPRTIIKAIELAKSSERPKVKNGGKALADYIIKTYLGRQYS